VHASVYTEVDGRAIRRETIYVELLGEGVAVWRPVEAERLEDGAYRILSQPPDRTEAWKFPAGSVVRCEEKTFSGGLKGLVARERVS
jgi:hypothetical protein